MNVVRALADIVATKLGIILLSFGANVVRAHACCACEGGLSACEGRHSATKLGIILSFSSFFLPRTFLPEGVCLGS